MTGGQARLTVELLNGTTEVVECRWVYVRDMCLTYSPVDLPEGTVIGIPLGQVSRFMTFTPPRIVGTAPVVMNGDTTAVR